MALVKGAGQRPTVSWAKHTEGEALSSYIAALFFPDSKRHASTSGLTERYFQLPAERFRIRFNSMHYIPALFASEINSLINKVSNVEF